MASLEDIKAYCGLARTQCREQAPNGMFIAWKGSARVEQLFIPGISDPHVGLTDTGRRAIQVVKRQKIETFQLWETNDINLTSPKKHLPGRYNLI